MLSYEWLISVAALLSLLAVLTACSMCGCRKTVPKNELLGLPGNVKLTNPEESLNHNYLSGNAVAINAPVGHRRSCADITDAGRRATSTANRSLPDIPIDSEQVRVDSGDTLWENNEPNGDTCSELYATVQENTKQPLVLVQSSGQVSKITSSIAASDDGKSSEYSSLSQTDDSFSPYAQVKSEHPYDRLKKSEHPYAQVGSSSVRGAKSDARLSAPPGGSSMNPIPPPRTRKSNSFNSDISPTIPSANSSPTVDIPAATAIAGRISANQELPYMTPPIPTPAMVSEPQTHFSGDSQDSSKGYTSISVREPLANIKAQTRQRSRTQELADSLYATVSDDSEEMYAAIEDPQSMYTSGSETYAQIQPLKVVEPATIPTEPVSEGPHIPPQPPSVDSLKHVAQVHSRQASSSSAASSVANLGSPKPEKRQANSPLPPPPAGSPELYATVDKKSTRDALTAEKTLEEMYAKVMKKTPKGSTHELARDIVDDSTSLESCLTKRRLSSVDSDREVAPQETESPIANRVGDNISRASVDMSSSHESIELRVKREQSDVDAESTSSTSTEDNSSKTDQSETIQHPYHQFPVTKLYESVDGFNSIPYIDPGYEVVQRTKSERKSESDPNYEELRPQVADTDFVSYMSIDSNIGLSEPGYASIGQTEPGYEEVRSNIQRPGYVSGSKSTIKNTDEPKYESMKNDGTSKRLSGSYPNYETVTNDPNYESVINDVASLQVHNSYPNYETLKDDPNYESVNYRELPSDPPYERLNNESRDSESELKDSDSLFGYEKVSGSKSTDGQDMKQ